MKTRQFWLENQNGEMWYFTEHDSNTFMDSPSGLGFSTNYGGFRIGDAEVVTFIQYALGTVEGTLKFMGENRAEVYKQYFDFNKFIANNSLLKLHYRTPNSFNSYYCYCFVQELDKTEMDNRRYVMNCRIAFKRQTFWRNDEKTSLLVKDVPSGESKRYQLKRPYSYASSMLSNMKIVNRGNVEAALKVTINGTVTNPMLSIYANDIKYGAMKMLGTFDKVTVDADDLNEYIQLEKDGAILVAPYSYQDLTVGSPQETYVTFIKVRPGESKGVFTFDGVFNGEITLEWSDNYVTV